MKQHWVIAYDIADDRRRRKVVKELEAAATRVQESVFECITGERELLEMMGRLARLIERREDSVRYYELCGPCARRIRTVGVGVRIEDPEYHVV